jgi:hypothetical protein
VAKPGDTELVLLMYECAGVLSPGGGWWSNLGTRNLFYLRTNVLVY